MARKQRSPLGRRLKWASEQAGLTSEVLAERLGVGPSTVRGWWTGHSEPSVDMLRQYAALTGVSADYLVSGSYQPTGQSGTIEQWRLRFAEMIRQGVDPTEAFDRMVGAPHLNRTGIPEEKLTEQERQLLQGAGPAMNGVLDEMSGGRWDRLTDDQKQALLHLIETMAPNGAATGS